LAEALTASTTDQFLLLGTKVFASFSAAIHGAKVHLVTKTLVKKTHKYPKSHFKRCHLTGNSVIMLFISHLAVCVRGIWMGSVCGNIPFLTKTRTVILDGSVILSIIWQDTYLRLKKHLESTVLCIRCWNIK
jgi:hypothetical protein